MSKRNDVQAYMRSTIHEDGTLTEATDIFREYQNEVNRFLQLYRELTKWKKNIIQSKEFWDYFAGLPICPPLLAKVPHKELVIKFRNLFALSLVDRLNVDAAMHTHWYFMCTLPYPLAILFGAAQHGLGLQTHFMTDAFVGIATSLLHKDIALLSPRYTTNARMWFCNVADPAAGKSPSMDPFLKVLRRVLQKNAGSMPGNANSNYHLQCKCTHAAARDRIKSTDGYLLLASAEAGQYLCPTYAEKGKWDQNRSVDLPGTFLDAATGGAVEWETAHEQKNKERKKRKRDTVDDKIIEAAEAPENTVKHCIQETNMGVIFMHQPSFFRKFWAKAQYKFNVGMSARFCFGFGCDISERLDSRYEGMFRTLIEPFCELFFTTILRRLGPRAPIGAVPSLIQWHPTEDALDLIRIMTRLQKEYAKRTKNPFLQGASSKQGYWVASMAMYNEILYQTIHLCSPFHRRKETYEPIVSFHSTSLAVHFFLQKVLIGYGVLQTEMALQLWDEEGASGDTFHNNEEEMCAKILRAVPFARITIKDVASSLAEFEHALNPRSTRRQILQTEICTYFEVFERMGFGIYMQDAHVFAKYRYDRLHRQAKQRLRALGICCHSFGGDCVHIDALLRPREAHSSTQAHAERNETKTADLRMAKASAGIGNVPAKVASSPSKLPPVSKKSSIPQRTLPPPHVLAPPAPTQAQEPGPLATLRPKVSTLEVAKARACASEHVATVIKVPIPFPPKGNRIVAPEAASVPKKNTSAPLHSQTSSSQNPTTHGTPSP